MTPLEDIDADFCHWLAGFTAGEGHFGVYSGNGWYWCQFDIRLRCDDQPILDEIHSILDIGHVYKQSRSAEMPPTHHPTAVFTVRAKDECASLCGFFEKYPIRAKKNRDFEIWSEAVRFMIAHRYRESWDELAEIAKRLKVSKKFGGGDE